MKPDTQARISLLLKRSKLFGAVQESLRNAISAHATLQTVTEGQRLWRGGEPAGYFSIIAAGIAKIVRVSPDGVESIVGLFGPRESIGDLAVIGEKPFPADAAAASPVLETVRIEAAPVLKLAQENPPLRDAFQSSLLDHSETLQHKIRIMSAGSVEQRLATLLFCLHERFGDDTEDGSLLIPLTLSRLELAAFIGARVETTIRAIRQWEKAGVLTTSAEGFQIHQLGALEAFMRADSAGSKLSE